MMYVNEKLNHDGLMLLIDQSIHLKENSNSDNK
jgi:hypothetical protein